MLVADKTSAKDCNPKGIQGPSMGTQRTHLLVGTGAWFSNVSSSILLIFVNKVLMSRTGYGFRYGTRWSTCIALTSIDRTASCLHVELRYNGSA